MTASTGPRKGAERPIRQSEARRYKRALEALDGILTDEINVRFGTSSHMTPEQVAGKSRVYSLLVVPRDIARKALLPPPKPARKRK